MDACAHVYLVWITSDVFQSIILPQDIILALLLSHTWISSSHLIAFIKMHTFFVRLCDTSLSLSLHVLLFALSLLKSEA